MIDRRTKACTRRTYISPIYTICAVSWLCATNVVQTFTPSTERKRTAINLVTEESAEDVERSGCLRNVEGKKRRRVGGLAVVERLFILMLIIGV